MRLLLCIILILILAVPGFACAEDVWMLVLNVGKGDAILVGVDDTVCLIDTGYPYVRGRILAGMSRMGVTSLDSVMITHTDKDHVGGLEWLADSDIPVNSWYASAYYMDVKESKHPLKKAAQARGKEEKWLKAGDRVSLGSAVLSVLGPVEEADDKDDNNSLVMMLETREGKILLAGDMEEVEEETLLDAGVLLKTDVLKVGNHGDDDATGKAFAQEAAPSLSVISTSPAEKPGTPSPEVVERLRKLGSTVVCTVDSGLGILVRLSGGKASWEYVDMPGTDAVSLVSIRSVDADHDIIELFNSGNTEADMTDAYLYSETGSEMMVFPSGTVIPAGGTLRVGTLSSDREADVVWQDKKVIHAKKADTVMLYDAAGRMVSSMDNGR